MPLEKSLAMGAALSRAFALMEFSPAQRRALEAGDPAMAGALRLFERLPWLEGEYARHGIPEEVLRATLSDFPLWMRAHEREMGRVGFAQEKWLEGHMSFGLFRLGRLQFAPEKCRVPALAYRGAGGALFAIAGGQRIDERGVPIAPARAEETEGLEPLLAPGDDVLAVHIPEGEPIAMEAVLDSLARAREFFPRHMGYRARAFTCESWLLDPSIEAMGISGNIVAFQRLFYRVDDGGDDAQTLERVFGGPVDDWPAAPEDTALRRAMKGWYLSGRRARSMWGFIIL